MDKKKPGISFALTDAHVQALRVIGGDRAVRVLGKVVGKTVDVEYIACNAPFVAGVGGFASCNSAFSSCNAAFSSCNAAFSTKK